MTRKNRSQAIAAGILVATMLTVAFVPMTNAADGAPADGTPLDGTIEDVLPRTDVRPACFGEDGAHGDIEDSEPDILCPSQTDRGASCVSHGIVVVERDSTGAIGDVTYTASTSRAETEPGFQEAAFPELDAKPPKDPQAHADASQAGVSYTHTGSGLQVSSDTVYSRCDVLALAYDWPVTNAYGNAGVEDLDVSLPSMPILSLDALDYEVEALGYGFAEAVHTCEIVGLQVLGSGPSICPGPNSGANAGLVSVTFNEAWGPVFQPNPGTGQGQWTYGGAAAHLSFTTSAQTVDIYIGYSAVAVHGEEAGPIEFLG